MTAQAKVVGIEPHDAQLVARIEGQTRDLKIALTWIEASVEGTDQLAAFAASQRAEFVVQLQPTAAGGLRVFVYAAATQALRVRAVPPPSDSDRLGASSRAETAALIVRGELSAALAGEPEEPPAQAVTTPSQTAPSPPSAAVAKATPELSATSGGDEPDAAALGLSVAAGAALPGASLLFPSASLGLHYRAHAIEVGIDAGSSLAQTLRRDELNLSLRQSELRVELAARFALSVRIAFLVGAEAGVRLVTRSTAATAGDQMATPGHTAWSALVGPVAQLHWQFAHSVGLALRIGLDFIPRPTRFAFQTSDGTQQRLGQLSTTAPWAALALSVDIWK